MVGVTHVNMVSDAEVQEEILGIMCEAFDENPTTLHITGQSLVNDVRDNLPSINDDDEVIYHIRRLNDDLAIDFSPAIGGVGTVSLKASGIEKYEQLSQNIVVPNEDIVAVLEALFNEERNNPRSPALSRDELLQQTGMAEKDLDKVVWYLKEKYWADVQTYVGKPWYGTSAITESGRRVYENLQ